MPVDFNKRLQTTPDVEARKDALKKALADKRQPTPKAADSGPRPTAVARLGAVVYDDDETLPPITNPNFRELVSSALKKQKDQEDAQQFEFTFPDGITVRVAFELNHGQQCALEELAEWYNDPARPFFCLKGYAGTGKTTIMKLFVQYMHRVGARRMADDVGSGARGYFEAGSGDILLAAPTHRARTVLYALAGDQVPKENCHTIHSLLALRPDFDVEELDVKNLKFNQAEGKQSKLGRKATLLVDECSMLGDKLVDVLEDQATRLQVKICYIGDPCQIKPVKQEHLSKSFLTPSGAELTQVMRQADGNPISYLLETIRTNQNHPSDAFERSDLLSAKGEGIIFISSSQQAKAWVLEKVLSEEFQSDINYVRVLCGTNKRVLAYNQSIRGVRYGKEAEEYHVGELLSGYANYGTDEDSYDFQPLIVNSADYLVTAAFPKDKIIYIDHNSERVGLTVPGWQLTLVDGDGSGPPERRRKKSIFILSRDCGQDVLHMLSTYLLELQAAARRAKGPTKKLAWNKFFAFQESFCTASDYVENGYTRIKRTLGYGYAMTVHKSQGGTYSYVLVDEADIDSAFGRENQLRHQLKYVALSRASKQVLCLTAQAIIEPTFDF